jgi:hypothetical protein
MDQTAPLISAEVILKSEVGRSMVNTDVPITSQNVEDFRPSKRLLEDAVSHLKNLGFDVSSNGFTLTIRGKKALFEELFKVELAVDVATHGRRMNVRSDTELSIPHKLSDIVERVVFTPLPQSFSN